MAQCSFIPLTTLLPGHNKLVGVVSLMTGLAFSASSARAQGISPETSKGPSSSSDSQTAPSSTPPDQPQAVIPPIIPKRRKLLRLELGGRAGYSLPIGDTTEGNQLGDIAKGAIPLQFDGWLRFRGGSAFGLYAQFAPGLSGPALSDNCKDCSVSEFRAGLQLAQHFNNGRSFDPWIGLGVGIEQLHVTRDITLTGIDSNGALRDVNGRNTSILKASPELMFQVGFDVGSDELAFGPFASVHWAAFSKQENKVDCTDLACPDTSVASDERGIPSSSRASHLWLQFGLRGTYLR